MAMSDARLKKISKRISKAVLKDASDWAIIETCQSVEKILEETSNDGWDSCAIAVIRFFRRKGSPEAMEVLRQFLKSENMGELLPDGDVET